MTMSRQRKGAPIAVEAPQEDPRTLLQKNVELPPTKVPGGTQPVKRTLTPLRAIRANCLDCCAGQRREVRECHLTDCPLWPFRMGRNPKRAGIGRKPLLNAPFQSPEGVVGHDD